VSVCSGNDAPRGCVVASPGAVLQHRVGALMTTPPQRQSKQVCSACAERQGSLSRQHATIQPTHCHLVCFPIIGRNVYISPGATWRLLPPDSNFAIGRGLEERLPSLSATSASEVGFAVASIP
jgi:hypothetical protein